MPKSDLWALLEENGRSGVYPMHMPGHKRQDHDLCPGFPWRCDITEIDGFDDLHHPQGILLEAQQRAARLFGSDEAWLLVNGSTCGLLAAVGACTDPGDTVLIARNCHKSAYHALELWGLRPVYLEPACGPFPFCGSIPPEAVEKALRQFPTVRTVILTSPTYEGVVSDIGRIAALCHRAHIPLIVDSAHGAHLGFDPGFPKSAVQCGADLVVQSLHKTLPAPTQTAVLHRSGTLVDPERVSHQLDIFETSSPSYPLLAMADRCLQLLEQEGQVRFSAYQQRLARLEKRCRALQNLVLYTEERLQQEAGFCWDFDPGKLVIGCGSCGLDGPALMERLRTGFRIEAEMALPGYLLAMTSLMDSDEGLDRLADALLSLDRQAGFAAKPPDPPVPPVPRSVLSVGEALRADWEPVRWQDAAGRVSAQYLWAYPPGVPWVTPGEEIEEDCIRAVLRAGEAGISLRATRKTPPGTAAVLASTKA